MTAAHSGRLPRTTKRLQRPPTKVSSLVAFLSLELTLLRPARRVWLQEHPTTTGAQLTRHIGPLSRAEHRAFLVMDSGARLIVFSRSDWVDSGCSVHLYGQGSQCASCVALLLESLLYFQPIAEAEEEHPARRSPTGVDFFLLSFFFRHSNASKSCWSEPRLCRLPLSSAARTSHPRRAPHSPHGSPENTPSPRR